MASTRRNMMGTRGAALQLGHDSSLAHAAFADDPDYEPEFEKLESDSVLAKYSLPIILLYLAGGTAFFAYSEEWEWTDSLYYSAVTLTTVGYGDMAPSNDASKIFAIGYIVGGLSIIATCLGVLVGQIQGSLDVTVMQKTKALSRTQKYLFAVFRSVFAVVIVVTIGASQNAESVL